MINSSFIKEQGQNPEEYFETIKEEYLPKWDSKRDQVKFSEEQLTFLQQEFFPIHIVVVSADWCPDCRTTVPILIRMAELSSFLDITIIDRDSHVNQVDSIRANGSFKVPLVLFINDKYEELTRWIERATYTYAIQYQSKLEAHETGEEMKEVMRRNFGKHSLKIMQATTNELFEQMMKAVYMLNANMQSQPISAGQKN